MNTIWIEHDRTDPAWNLACEEHFLTTRRERIAMLWRNKASVIIGRHQVLEDEVDAALAAERGIPIVRRLTGGGAVFHDLGNVNFSLMFAAGDGHAQDFAPFAALLIDALGALGIPAAQSVRNDILVEGKKVSGCAHVSTGGRALYHGTLLFGAELGQMEGLLRYKEEKYRGRGVASVSSRVANLSDWLPGWTVEAFLGHLRSHLRGNAAAYTLTEEDVRAVDALRASRYGNPEWTGKEVG